MKKAFLRGLLGFPFGVFIGYTITVFTSIAFGNGRYSAVVPSMTEQLGSEINAVIVQYVLCGLMGFAFAAMSAIWENDKLSLAAQSGINFVLSVMTVLPIAYICNWMEHSVSGLLSYLAIFAGIYASIWVVMFSVYKAKIKKINADLNKQ